jgi:hypothetical protein
MPSMRIASRRCAQRGVPFRPRCHQFTPEPCHKTLVQEVACGKPRVRVFVVHSRSGWSTSVASGKKPCAKCRQNSEKIGAAASRVLSRHHGFRYYAWELKQGQFHYFEHPQNFAGESSRKCKHGLERLQAQLVLQKGHSLVLAILIARPRKST